MPLSRLAICSLAASSIALSATTMTQAADLGHIMPTPAPAYTNINTSETADEWSGFYAGVTLGGATTEDLDFDIDDYGLTAGAQAGYLQQLGIFAVGAEVQGLWSDELYYALTPSAGLEQNWSIAAKGRAGVALGDFLVYGTGGATLAELNPSGTTSSGPDWHTGLVIGGGAEHKLGDNLSLRAEYLQTRFFDVESAVAGVAREDDLTNHTIAVGVNYRF